MIEQVQQALNWQREDSTETRLAKLEQGLAGYRFPVEESVPLLASLLSLTLPEGRYVPLTLTPQQQRQLTYDTLVAWMLEEAERQPLLAIWEDLHWADPSTLELLGQLIDEVPTVMMMNVLAYRPVFSPPWPTPSHVTPLVLNRLERAHTEALVRRLAGGKPLPADVQAHIVTKTDGVPLYVEELTKALMESDLLQEEAEQYVLTGSLSEATIPATLQDSLMARLDRLASVKEVAQLGAVVGREFAYDMLQSLAGLEEPVLQERLAQLVEAELLYQRGRPPRATYIFKHALVQDVAYQSLLRRTRQHYHQQVAQLMEQRFVDLAQTDPDLVAHHYTEAGRPERAIPYWRRAGELSLQRSANLEAARHLTTAIELLETQPENVERAEQELHLQLALAPALVATKGMAASEVEEVYARSRALCAQIGETSQIFPTLWGLWRFYQGRGALQSAQELGEELTGLAERWADPMRQLEAHDALGTTLLFRGDYDAARRHVEQGIDLIDPATQRDQAFRQGEASGVRCLAVAANILWCLGYPEQAVHRLDDALTLAQELDHSYSLSTAAYYAAFLHYRRRDPQQVQTQAEVLLNLADTQGFPLSAALGACWGGWAKAMQGEGKAGLQELRQGLESIIAIGQEVSRPIYMVLLAEAAGQADEIEDGLRWLNEALTILTNGKQEDLLAEAYRLQGMLCLTQSNPDAAQAEICFVKALSLARLQQAKSWELRAALSLSQLWHGQGKRSELSELLRPIYGGFTEGWNTLDLQEANQLLKEIGD